MPNAEKMPLPIKALAGLAGISSSVFCDCLAAFIIGGKAVLATTDPLALAATSAMAALFGVFQWNKNRQKKEQAQLFLDLLKQNANDTLTALQLITDIARGNLHVSVKIDEILKFEIQDGCRRALEAQRNGLSAQDATAILAAIQQTATRDQMAALQADFDDFQEVTTMLLWTADHRGREHNVILRSIEQLVAQVASQCPALIRIEQKIDESRREINQKIDDSTQAILKKLDETQQLRAQNDLLREENEKLRDQVRAAVESVAAAAKAGDESAEEVFENNDPAAVQAYLIRQIDAKAAQLATMQTHTKELTAEVIEGHRNIAALTYLRGDIDGAKKRIDAILRLAPDDLDALNRLGQIHYLRGDLAEAEKYYTVILQVARNEEVWKSMTYCNLGNIYRTRGDFDAAEDMYKMSLRIAEKIDYIECVASCYTNLGIIYYELRQLERATEMFEKAKLLEEVISKESL